MANRAGRVRGAGFPRKGCGCRQWFPHLVQTHRRLDFLHHYGLILVRDRLRNPNLHTLGVRQGVLERYLARSSRKVRAGGELLGRAGPRGAGPSKAMMQKKARASLGGHNFLRFGTGMFVLLAIGTDRRHYVQVTVNSATASSPCSRTAFENSVHRTRLGFECGICGLARGAGPRQRLLKGGVVLYGNSR